MRWQLQEAKQRFSELVQRVLDEGPQTVTRRGQEVVVVVSSKEFRRLSGSIPDFTDYLLTGPDFEELDLSRSKEPARVIDL
jgi:prevent-host-death family protein